MTRLEDLPPDQQAWVRKVVDPAPPLTPAQESGLVALCDDGDE